MNHLLYEQALETFGTLSKLLPSMVFPILSLEKDSDIPILQTLVLIKLDECGTCGLSQLANAVVISKQSMTVLSNDLLKKGYITRLKDPSDRRKVLVQLTELGQQYVQRRYQNSSQAFEMFFIDFTEEQLASLLRTSQQMISLLLQANYTFGDRYKEEARRNL